MHSEEYPRGPPRIKIIPFYKKYFIIFDFKRQNFIFQNFTLQIQ